jgi:H+/gluconate symporter-like permease
VRGLDRALDLHYETANFVLSRLSWFFFCLAFIIFLYGWAETINITNPNAKFNKVLKIVMLAVLVCVIIYMGVILGLRFTQCNTVLSNFCSYINNTNVLFLAWIQVLLSLCFLLYGGYLYYRLTQSKKESDASNIKNKKGIFLNIIIVNFVLFCCFLMRGIVFLWRPTIGSQMNEYVFYSLGYIVPDFIIPVCIMFVIVSSAKRRKKQLVPGGLFAADEYVALDGSHGKGEEEEPEWQ